MAVQHSAGKPLPHGAESPEPGLSALGGRGRLVLKARIADLQRLRIASIQL